jgi:carboxylesterase
MVDVKRTLVALAAVASGVGVIAGGWLLRRLMARRVERRTALRLPAGPDGIIRGAETIDIPAARGAPAVLLLHGFGDTPQTLKYLAAQLSREGYAVRAPLLPGHGRTLRDFARSSADDWLDFAREEHIRMRDRHGPVAIVGLSMGGAIASVLAAETQDLPALVLIAPYLGMPAALARLARRPWLVSPLATYLSSRGDRSIHDEAESKENLGYGAVTPHLLAELMRMARMGSDALPEITAPTLVIQSREDNRIGVEGGEVAYSRLGSETRQMLWLEGCGHVITVDRCREHVIEATAEWLGGSRMKKRDGRRRPASSRA